MTIGTFVRTANLAFLCSLLAACGASGPAHPAGWTQSGKNVWKSGAQTYSVRSEPYGDDIKEFASQEAIGVVLREKHARFISSYQYEGCPGLAALLTFQVATKPPQTLLEGITVWKGRATVVAYERPASTAEDPAVDPAMKATICTL